MSESNQLPMYHANHSYDIAFMVFKSAELDKITYSEFLRVLQYRQKLDHMLSSVSTRKKLPISDLIDLLQKEGINNEYWGKYRLLKLLIANKVSVSKTDISNIYKVIYKVITYLYENDFYKIHYEVNLSRDEIASITLGLFKTSLEKNKNTGIKLPEEYPFLLDEYTCINESIDLQKVLDIYLDFPGVFNYLDDSIVKSFTDWYEEYCIKNPDYYFEEQGTKKVVNELLSCYKDLVMDELINKAKNMLEKLSSLDLNTIDYNIINFTLGQCKEMIENEDNYERRTENSE